MKRFIFFAILFLFVFSFAKANPIKEMNLDIDIQGKEPIVNAEYIFTDEIKEINFPCDCDFGSIEIEDGYCEKEKEINNILVCRPKSPFMVGTLKIHPSFKLKDVITKQGNISYFSLDVPILEETEKVEINVKIPNGMALADNKNYPLSPSDGTIWSDGRRIIITWTSEEVKKGDVIPIRIYYESLSAGITSYLNQKWFVILIFGVILSVVITNRFLSRRSQLVLSVLNENEKMAVDIIKSQHKDKVDQREIVKLSGFSKAKVSRIIQSLEERGIVEREKRGRKNKISLKRKILQEI